MAKSGLAPVVNRKTRILILGSFPGGISLQRQEYYANPKNQFWCLVSDVVGDDITGLSYPERLNCLLKYGIGLWDVIASCKRQGSRDPSIRCAQRNDIPVLLKKYPGIKAIFFNGRKAQKAFLPMATICRIPAYYLPSSSPAYAIPYERKLKAWLAVKAVLEGKPISSAKNLLQDKP